MRARAHFCWRHFFFFIYPFLSLSFLPSITLFSCNWLTVAKTLGWLPPRPLSRLRRGPLRQRHWEVALCLRPLRHQCGGPEVPTCERVGSGGAEELRNTGLKTLVRMQSGLDEPTGQPWLTSVQVQYDGEQWQRPTIGSNLQFTNSVSIKLIRI